MVYIILQWVVISGVYNVVRGDVVVRNLPPLVPRAGLHLGADEVLALELQVHLLRLVRDHEGDHHLDSEQRSNIEIKRGNNK